MHLKVLKVTIFLKNGAFQRIKITDARMQYLNKLCYIGVCMKNIFNS